MALLSLLLGFTFGMSMNWHNERRLAVVADANSIGDFYTCASLLREPVRSKLQAVIFDYAKARLDLARSRPSIAEVNKSLAQFEDQHRGMTELAREAIDDGTPIAVSLTNTLNELTSNHAARLAAAKTRLPAPIVVLLFVTAAVTTFLIGREQGICGHPELAGTLSFVALVAIAIFVTIDLNRPEVGMISVSQEPLERLVGSMTK
jgi:hypothetical protein